MACDLGADNRYTLRAITMNTSHQTAPRPNGQLTVGLISNPHSGRNRKHLDTIRKIVTDYPNVHHRTTQTANDIPAALEAFARQPVDILANDRVRLAAGLAALGALALLGAEGARTTLLSVPMNFQSGCS